MCEFSKPQKMRNTTLSDVSLGITLERNVLSRKSSETLIFQNPINMQMYLLPNFYSILGILWQASTSDHTLRQIIWFWAEKCNTHTRTYLSFLGKQIRQILNTSYFLFIWCNSVFSVQPNISSIFCLRFLFHLLNQPQEKQVYLYLQFEKWHREIYNMRQLSD